jgi:hypothetical protein
MPDGRPRAAREQAHEQLEFRKRTLREKCYAAAAEHGRALFARLQQDDAHQREAEHHVQDGDEELHGVL